jgi:uncharacterized protein YbbC (DUF1343 family)/CubicO group peptidase (beta-lactamase class C family)
VKSTWWLALVGGLGLGALLMACRAPRLPAKAAPEPAFHADKLAEMDAAILQAIAVQKLPGAVLWLEHRGAVYHKAYGRRAVVPAPEPMTPDTLFDLASLTKVVACTPAVMLLVERGQVKLDDPVCRYLHEFTGGGREAVTLRHLLTHTAGLRPDISLKPDWSGYEAGLKLCLAEALTARPGERFIYSDTGPILLGEIVRRVTGRRLDEFLAAEVYRPLGMRDTGFNPPPGLRGRVAPTEVENGAPLRGVVHDPRARRLGGVAGHAGLFSTAADLARFARMMLNGGVLDGVRIFRPETVRLMTSVQTPPGLPRRGLGWDIDSAYAGPRGELFPLGSYGHTGWTGTSLWIDPFSQTFVILLANRNHPDERGSVTALRRQLGTLAAQAVRDFNFSHVPGALAPDPARAATSATTNTTPAPAAHPAGAGAVLHGIDVLVKQNFAPLRGLRVGLITNHTGHDRARRATIDLLHAAPEVKLVALFSPEHGIRGTLDEQVSDSVDERTGLPVFSLYGETRAPTPEQLAGLDALVFDVQDIGCRFYTYISTMGLAMEAAARAGKKFFVLDRVNPINGRTLEGPVHAGAPTFVAFHRLPLRHGMTVGELARLFNAERGWNCALTVIPLEGWSRAQWWDQTGQPWTNPSPNMRRLTAAVLYPGVGLLESAVSVGRGTDTPFEVVGAPYVADDVAFAAEVNRAGLPGVRAVPVRFTPRASTFKDQPCGGVQLVVTDREALRAVDLGLTLALTFQRLYPGQFAADKMLPLLTDRVTLEAVKAGKPLAEIKRAWAAELAAFEKRRAAFLLYE